MNMNMPKNKEALDFFNKWSGLIHDARRNFVRAHGLHPAWLIMSQQSWAELKAGLGLMTPYAAQVESRRPTEVFGLKVAILDCFDQSFEFMEVR